MEQLLDFKGYK